MSQLVGTLFVALAVSSQLQAFEVEAVLRRIDVDKQVVAVLANGQERTVRLSSEVTILDENGKNLSGGLSAKELKEGTKVTLTVQRDGNMSVIMSIRLGGKPNRPGGRVSVGRTSVALKPLTEMTADDVYKGEDGGLYGGGRNEPPDSLSTAAKTVTAKIQPLDSNGQPNAAGKIGLVSISMSNATQEFSRFKQLADADDETSPLVHVVDCAQGGQTMALWADPKAACWNEADRRLRSADVSRAQVQVAWVKLANAGPRGELEEHGRRLEHDTRDVLANLKHHFPNLQIAYLGSRIYGGYADGALNPEPFAYEGAFVVRWLIRSQVEGDAELNFDPEPGEVKSPLLLWGPYFWADGMTPRESDGLIWERSDFASDGTHPGKSGRQKVAEQLLNFFRTDPNTRTWFVKK